MTEILVKTLVATLVGILSSTVKNPRSDSARRLRKYVQTVNEATGQFLEQVPEA